MEVSVEINRTEGKILGVLVLLTLLLDIGASTINVRDSGSFNLFTTLDMNNSTIENVGPANDPGDAVNKTYVDSVASGSCILSFGSSTWRSVSYAGSGSYEFRDLEIQVKS